MKAFFLMLMLAPFSIFASDLAPVKHKAMIEAMDLESQTITLHGQSYRFATQISIKTTDQRAVGFNALNVGQVIEFATSTGQIQSPGSNTSTTETITEIQILSDNRKQDEIHD